MPKQRLRQAILARRKALAAAEAKAISLKVQRTFIDSAEFAGARVLALYAPIHNEVDTSEVFAAALTALKTVLFPAVSGEGLVFRRVSTRDGLRKGAFGIPEPVASCEVYEPGEADIIVIPGVAFDMKGKRIGYGKGYYDKALHSLEGGGKLVGLCYDFQLVDDITDEPHDVKMDLLITEKRVIRPRDYHIGGT
ncbi:MAG: 5-formyltetrahydrofolate cyclo-ligase [Geobacteraceae bacterium]|nr:5-formyltetrahydrofolate cyclo-ligase [Geobacteraceae bacterium]